MTMRGFQLLSCMAQIPPGEAVTDEVMYSVSAREIAEASGADPDAVYQELKEATMRLKHRDIRVEREPNGRKKKRSALVFSWIQSIEYVDQEGRVAVRFNKDVLPYLTLLTERFTRYRLDAVSKMTSAHAIRFYELIAQWRTRGNVELEVAALRKALCLEGRYPSIKDFKQWVLEPSMAQINAHSDLNVRYVQRKTGRVVTHFHFFFDPKKDKRAQTRLITRDYIAANARPGESWEEAARRLSPT
jgi:plasmid replication initiation protein